MNILDVVEDAVNQFEDQLTKMTSVRASELGLDERAGYRLYINSDCVIAGETAAKSLNYYGGFSYIDPADIIQFAEYTIYRRDASRVDEALSYYENRKEKND